MKAVRCYACHTDIVPTATGCCDLCSAVIDYRLEVALLAIRLGCLARKLWCAGRLPDLLGVDAKSIVEALAKTKRSPQEIDAALGLPPGSFEAALQSQAVVLRAQRGLIGAHRR
jgi:hypothetical protein